VNAGLLGVVAAEALEDIGEPKDRWGVSHRHHVQRTRTSALPEA
jgi:hypothetical protein